MHKKISMFLFLISTICLTFGFFTYQQHKQLLSDFDSVTASNKELHDELSHFKERYTETNRIWDLIEAHEYFEQSTPSIDRDLALHLPTIIEDQYSAVVKDAYLDSFLVSGAERYQFGIVITESNNDFYFSNIMENSSAHEDGIEVGDKLLSFNYKPAYKWTMDDLRGLFSSYDTIRIEVLKKDMQTYTYILKKRTLKAEGPQSRLVTDNTAYVKFGVFDDGIRLSLFPRLKSYSDKDISYLILDLRNNLGGGMVYGHDLINFFSDSQTPYIFKNASKETFIGTLPFAPNLELKDFKTDFKLYILINRYTASASEFVTSSLKTHENAIVIGEESRGKGVMQEFFPLSNDTYMKLTTHEFYPAEGMEFHGKGITPDYLVESLPWVTPDVDEALEKALELIEIDS